MTHHLFFTPLGNLFVEASVVGVITIVFLILFVVAGIRQMIKLGNDEGEDEQ